MHTFISPLLWAFAEQAMPYLLYAIYGLVAVCLGVLALCGLSWHEAQEPTPPSCC